MPRRIITDSLTDPFSQRDAVLNGTGLRERSRAEVPQKVTVASKKPEDPNKKVGRNKFGDSVSYEDLRQKGR